MIWRIVSVALMAAALGCAAIWNARRALEYSEDGRHLDRSTGVVLDEQAVLVYGALSVAFAVLSGAVWFWGSRR